jgi:HK97 family phage prohead protease/HK97 family phage major capsid protein
MKDLLQLKASFTEKSINEEDGSLIIRGYASTVAKDRTGDVIVHDAWTKGGLANYLKNPVILAFHDHKRPIGKMVEYSIDEKGLNITAKISKAAGDITDLIKDGILQAFSVGFRLKDADYDSDSDTFLIKDLELHEVSVVSVPANQDSLFSLAKCFDSETDFAEFKQKFVKPPEAGGDPADNTDHNKEEFIMTPEELKQLIAETMGAESAKQKALEEEAKRAAEAEKSRNAEIAKIAAAAASEAVAVVKSNAEALVADLKKAQEESEQTFAKKVAELQGEIATKAEEISRITRASKVEFGDRAGSGPIDARTEKQVAEAALLGRILKKSVLETGYARSIIEKATNQSSNFKLPTDSEAYWETTLANRLEEDVRLQLVVAPMFREIAMNAAQQVITINPDMGYADWVAAAEISGGTRTAATTDPTIGKTLEQIMLSTHKLAAKTYLTDETEEDSIIPILPLIYDGLARAHARKIEWALLNNDSASATGESSVSFADGLVKRTATLSTKVMADASGSAKVIAGGTAKFDHTHVLAARRKMGVYGLNPNEVMGILSLDAWYDLLEDVEFANLNEVGSQAQKLTGVVGRVYGINFVVSPEMPAEANGAAAIVLVNPRNYLMPRLRGYTVQTDYDVEFQRRVLVATQRIGFSHIISTAKAVACVAYDADGT